MDKLNKILTNYLVQIAIVTNFKTAHSHYNSSSSQHSTKIIILSENIVILPLLLVKRIFGIFIWKPKEYSNTKIIICLSPSVHLCHRDTLYNLLNYLHKNQSFNGPWIGALITHARAWCNVSTSYYYISKYFEKYS